MENTIDAHTILSRNVLAVIRKFFHRNLAMKYTCLKKIENKQTLKPSIFYDCIKGKIILLNSTINLLVYLFINIYLLTINNFRSLFD